MRRPRIRFGAPLALAFATGLASLAPAAPVAAATAWYQVEVVIFAEGGESRWDRDDWREEGPPPLADNTVELLAALAPADVARGSARRHAFRTLPATELGLTAAANRLDRSSAYRVLLHVGWRQPGFPYDDAPAVHLGTQRGLVSDDRFAAAPGESVDGTVRVWRRRFLHVEADLAFGEIVAWLRREAAAAGPAPPRIESGATPEAGPGPRVRAEEARAPRDATQAAGEDGEPQAVRDVRPLRVARLTRSLRLRAGRLYYIDHPLFGVLLNVKRLRNP